MERKTQVSAEDGKQDLTITREFELPVELLFRAYSEPEILAQWMGTKVLKHESKSHGSYQFETVNEQGVVVFRANGVIHEFTENKKIVRTFEIENAPFPVQLEFIEFHKLTDETSKLSIHIVYRSVDHRQQVLQLPFAQNLNWAHNRLQDILQKMKNR